MKRSEIERLREAVQCQTVLETSGFALDVKESTRRAMKYRRGSEIIIVTHAGRGWFDPLGEEKGDVFSLMACLENCVFLEACDRVGALVGAQSSQPIWVHEDRALADLTSISESWALRRPSWPGSASWRYLRWQRCIPASIIRAAIGHGILREGPFGSMWAAHTDETGAVCGWEARGPQWRGFATGGRKTLFRLGCSQAFRLCVTEAAIDAMSLAALEGMRDATLYLSTGGGWAPATEAALRLLAARSNVQLVAATDANSQGDAYADRLRALADDVGCIWLRLRPSADDWNEVLKQREKGRMERKMEGDVPHTRQPHQGRLCPATPALDPADRNAGDRRGVMKDRREE
ncbi:hypothetical protein BLJAPNOD_05428 [Ensifer sp. M14]|uniref:DUF3991 domain-containing protein n=1 Tax=Sinorhizobium sp. M14 TaxID=430451 RepID=A0A142BPW1_9HYPH|nr:MULTISPECIES: DUF3991 and toprim domain-containing protein [Sinorhizobium/Ensifer group]AMP35119.1 hypothetical protein pSinB_260 [Sinorhizobium sp. M14]RDL47706.1 hypothetical protein BLJAPNOD_05428 [Ensifer sp. M14]